MYKRQSQVSEDVLAEEKKILVAQMDNDEKMASKPLQVKEKIACLLYTSCFMFPHLLGVQKL